MLVRDIMTPNPYTVRPESDYLAAIAIMRAGKFRHLPVVNEEGQLVGLISDRDLKGAQPGQPSPEAVTGDGVLLRVGEVMKRHVITCPPDYPIEEAARLMIKHRISSLVVVKGGRVLGILTDTDLFHQFVAMLGGGSKALRVTVQVDNRPGQFAAVAGAVASVGGNILSIASHPTEDTERINLTLRVEAVPLEALTETITAIPGAEILHTWLPR
ncbi:MAG TPA: CBS domain-containing protein [Chloroflexi bacterium]|nr:CBS domain-containing protein [Chloroflexota bacterium]